MGRPFLVAGTAGSEERLAACSDELHGAMFSAGHTWCVWDSLFIPEIIKQTAHVESTCQVTGDKIRLTVSPSGVKEVDPAGAVMSFLIPDAGKVKENVMASFCHFVYFFCSAEAGEEWASEREGILLLSVEEAYELGRRLNEHLYRDLAAV